MSKQALRVLILLYRRLNAFYRKNSLSTFKSSQESVEELDLELKRAKLDLYRKQTEGQELLNEARRLAIEKLKIEVKL